MFRIIRKEVLNSAVKLLEVEAPYIARKAEPGQFIILRVNKEGETIPLTIADYDRQKGTITIIFQEVGKTTKLLGTLEKDDTILDFAGPLGVASHLEGYKKAAVIGLKDLGCSGSGLASNIFHSWDNGISFLAILDTVPPA